MGEGAEAVGQASGLLDDPVDGLGAAVAQREAPQRPPRHPPKRPNPPFEALPGPARGVLSLHGSVSVRTRGGVSTELPDQRQRISLRRVFASWQPTTSALLSPAQTHPTLQKNRDSFERASSPPTASRRPLLTYCEPPTIGRVRRLPHSANAPITPRASRRYQPATRR